MRPDVALPTQHPCKLGAWSAGAPQTLADQRGAECPGLSDAAGLILKRSLSGVSWLRVGQCSPDTLAPLGLQHALFHLGTHSELGARAPSVQEVRALG